MQRAEYLFYFRPAETDLGTMPAHYVAVPECERADALKHGGIDCSDNDADWTAWEREHAI